MKKKEKLNLGPVFTIMILIVIVVLASVLCSFLQVRADKTSIVNGSLETSVTSVRNFLSLDGITYFFSNAVTNLALFEPLFLLILSLIGISIGERSGLFKAVFAPFKKIKLGVITAFVLFISIISTFLGEYSFAILLPFAGVLYKYLGKNPLLGIFTVFIGITSGYASGLLPNYNTFTLGELTRISARVDVDSAYQFSLFSQFYIMIGSTILLVILETFFIHTFLLPKLPNVKVEIEEDLRISKKALICSNIAFVLMICFVLYLIVPGFFGSGILLDKSENNYIIKLLGENAPFRSAIVYIVSIIFMFCSYVYGKISGNIKNSTDYSVGLSKSFDDLGYVFVLVFFASQLVGILNWTNLGEVFASFFISLLSYAQFSGIPLILVTFLLIFIIGLIVPGTLEKWTLASPIVVPLFMRANLTPEFTQYIFMVADGLSKSITPIFPYFIILVAFLEKYNTDEKRKITIFGTIKMILPTILMLILVWILILVGWYIVGLPLGLKGSVIL